LNGRIFLGFYREPSFLISKRVLGFSQSLIALLVTARYVPRPAINYD
jgi:hypothetical protein